MRFEFLPVDDPQRSQAERHIAEVYRRCYGAEVTQFAPLLAAAFGADGKVLCAAGIRTAQDGFFSDCYLESGFPVALAEATGLDIGAGQIMEVTSLASISPFPVLPLLDRMIGWGRARGIVCGVFTATHPLRRLLTRAGLGCSALCAATADKVAVPDAWGRYYEADPWVCAFVEGEGRRADLVPGRKPAGLREAMA